jgi:hypothetical protein
MREDMSYRVLGTIDLTLMKVVLGARVHEAEDNVLALREDPSYFAERMYENHEHIPETTSLDRL